MPCTPVDEVEIACDRVIEAVRQLRKTLDDLLEIIEKQGEVPREELLTIIGSAAHRIADVLATLLASLA